MSRMNSINNKAESISIDPGASDSFVQFSINETPKFIIGVDYTDDSFRISAGSALGTSDTLIMTADGELTLPLQPSSGAQKSSITYNVTGSGATYTIIPNIEIWDQSSNYSTATGYFTAPIAGKYLLSALYYSFGYSASIEENEFRIVCSNRFVEGLGYNNTLTTGIFTISGQPVVFGIVDMDASDTAHITVKGDGETSPTIDIYGESNNFHTALVVTLLH